MVEFCTDKEVLQIMGNCVDFVSELIDYIAEYPDDDYMTMECLCSFLQKRGLVDKKDGFYLVAGDTLRKDAPQTHDIHTNTRECVYQPKDEPQTELVNDSPILVKDLVDDEFNPYDEECMRCKHLKLKCEFIPTYCKFEPKDTPQTEPRVMSDLMREQMFCQWTISKVLALYITQEDFRNEVDSKVNDGYQFSINGEKMSNLEQTEWKLDMVCVDIAKQFTEYYFNALPMEVKGE